MGVGEEGVGCGIEGGLGALGGQRGIAEYYNCSQRSVHAPRSSVDADERRATDRREILIDRFVLRLPDFVTVPCRV